MYHFSSKHWRYAFLPDYEIYFIGAFVCACVMQWNYYITGHFNRSFICIYNANAALYNWICINMYHPSCICLKQDLIICICTMQIWNYISEWFYIHQANITEYIWGFFFNRMNFISLGLREVESMLMISGYTSLPQSLQVELLS